MRKNVVFRSGSLRMGGLERILIEVLQNIDKEKFNIQLIISDDCGEENIFKKDIPEEVECYFLKSQDFMKKIDSVRKNKKNFIFKLYYNYLMWYERKIELSKTKEIIKKIGPVDVLIDFDNGASKYIEKIDAAKKIAWLHNSVPKLLKKPGKIRRFGRRLAGYDKVVAICDDMKNETETIYPFLEGKITRIYNPFNFERILDLASDAKSLTDNQKKMTEEKYCVAVSRLDTVQKDYYTLFKAFKLLKEKGIKEKLYVIGEGSGRKEIENWIKELGLEDTVFLIGQTKNPYVWMKNAEIFIHSSRYEGLPTVLIEAMICGKIIVSTDCPTGPAEILQQGKAGYLCPVGDEKQLAAAIEEALKKLENKEIYEAIAERIEEFKSANVLKEYERLIEEL